VPGLLGQVEAVVRAAVGTVVQLGAALGKLHCYGHLEAEACHCDYCHCGCSAIVQYTTLQCSAVQCSASPRASFGPPPHTRLLLPLVTDTHIYI
jgi:hypothetical protein